MDAINNQFQRQPHNRQTYLNMYLKPEWSLKRLLFTIIYGLIIGLLSNKVINLFIGLIFFELIILILSSYTPGKTSYLFRFSLTVMYFIGWFLGRALMYYLFDDEVIKNDDFNPIEYKLF